MKNYLKDKKVLVGLLIAGAVAYYFYDKKRKADIKARAEELASTPATTTPEATTPTPTPILNPKKQTVGVLETVAKETI
jgi:uncharacterized membrane protein YebE (DUF533 family)